jgi:hypothetical protein
MISSIENDLGNIVCYNRRYGISKQALRLGAAKKFGCARGSMEVVYWFALRFVRSTETR